MTEIEGLRCASCGASVREGASKCEYCGTVFKNDAEMPVLATATAVGVLTLAGGTTTMGGSLRLLLEDDKRPSQCGTVIK